MQAGAVELIAGMLVSKTGRTGLFQVIYFVGPFCWVSAVFISVPLISGSWFRLTSLFQVSGSFSLLLFSLLQVQLLLFGCLDLTTVGHLITHRWPRLSNGKALPSCSPACYIFLQMSFQDYKLDSGAQLPLTMRFYKSVLLVALCFALRVWMAGQAGGIQRWLELCMCACMIVLRVHVPASQECLSSLVWEMEMHPQPTSRA